ncbi:MAG: hypothetical protein Q7T11_05460 [Deltaproteobacteria bacterium]|nr:hypothetical protein [Deltaproteobacteria bacterium]
MKLVGRITALFLILTVVSCSNGSGEAEREADLGGPQVSAMGSPALFTYTFLSKSTYGEEVVDLIFPETYTVPFYIKPDGQVTVLAREFPKMVLRICPTSSADPLCDVPMDAKGLGEGVDLVMDVCGEEQGHAECGPKDGSFYEGSLNEEGHLLVAALEVRIRVFLLDGDGPDGFEASVTASGLFPNLPRLKVVMQTDPEIRTGILSGIGSRVAEKAAVLVAGGIIPEGMEALSGEHYLAALDGTFDLKPLDLLQ